MTTMAGHPSRDICMWHIIAAVRSISLCHLWAYTKLPTVQRVLRVYKKSLLKARVENTMRKRQI